MYFQVKMNGNMSRTQKEIDSTVDFSAAADIKWLQVKCEEEKRSSTQSNHPSISTSNSSSSNPIIHQFPLAAAAAAAICLRRIGGYSLFYCYEERQSGQVLLVVQGALWEGAGCCSVSQPLERMHPRIGTSSTITTITTITITTTTTTTGVRTNTTIASNSTTVQTKDQVQG
jgi:hypothetical protein